MLIQTKIGSLLHEDHMATVAALQELEDFLHRNRTAPALDKVSALLAKLSATMRAEVEKHFGFEENHLFPVFVNLGETGIVTMLLHEHRSILPLALELANLADQALAAGSFDADSWKAFHDTGAELVEREVFHIQKEEMGLLSAIAALVDPSTDAELAETYKKVVG